MTGSGEKTIGGPPGGWQGWLNIGLLFVVLEVAVFSIERARWITPQPSLTLALVLSMLAAWLLARSTLPSAAAHVSALVIGILVVVCQAAVLLSGFQPLFLSLRSWWLGTGTAIPGGETISFAIFLSLVTWAIGHTGTWFLLRRRNAWVGVSLGAVIILANLSNLPDRYYFFFGGYFLAAMLLVALNRLVRENPAGRGAGYPLRGLLYFGASLAVLTVFAFSISWATPEVRVPRLQTAVATRILWKHDIEESPVNLFAAVPAKQPLSTSSTRRDLHFGKDWHQGEQIDYIVSSPRPSYWLVHVYDDYTPDGWANGPTDRYVLAEETAWAGTVTPAGRETITYEVETNMKTDVLLTAGSFVAADTPTLVQVGAGDIMAVTTPRVLHPEERYRVTSAVAAATPEDLAGAGESYPPEIAAAYLRLPPDFPESVRRLSRSIAGGAPTPYDKVTAIDNYLSRIPYNNEIQAPPPGTDGVAYFLFTQKSGFCLYYASAMAVMLRAVDVPARLAVGYLPGEAGDEKGQYILRDKHYHAWPQAYFPGYGWVDLEATPSTGDSEVAIETPWVGGQITGGDWQEWQDWYLWQMLAEAGFSGGPAAAGFNEIRTPGNPVWPFADELGRALLITIGGIILITLAASPLLARRSAFYRWLWDFNREDAAAMVYNRLCRLGAMAGLGPRAEQTPLEYAAELSATFPRQARSLDNIARTYADSQFGRRVAVGLFEEAELLKSRCDVFGNLLSRLKWFKKLFFRLKLSD
ncbi:MAG: transglutaminase domain-containing protein [Chloroflexota bacterium]